MNSNYITDSYKYTPLTRRLSCLAWPGLMLSLTGLLTGLHRAGLALETGLTIALWDHVFGTFIPAQERAPQAVGVADPDSFPADRHWLASQLHPFTRAEGFAQPIEQAETGA